MQQIIYFLQTSAMAGQRKAPDHHYNVPTHIFEHQLQRDLLPSCAVIFITHHSDRQQHFRTLFGCQTQLQLCKIYTILGIFPMTEMEDIQMYL